MPHDFKKWPWIPIDWPKNLPKNQKGNIKISYVDWFVIETCFKKERHRQQCSKKKKKKMTT